LNSNTILGEVRSPEKSVEEGLSSSLDNLTSDLKVDQNAPPYLNRMPNTIKTCV